LLEEALPLLPSPADSDGPLLAIDLGCPHALDSLELLHRGWTVLALTETVDSKRRLLAEAPRRESARLTVGIADFGALVLPPADLIYTGFELSLRPAAAFGPVWSRIVPALRPGGWFVGRFLGDLGRFLFLDSYGFPKRLGFVFIYFRNNPLDPTGWAKILLSLILGVDEYVLVHPAFHYAFHSLPFNRN